MNSKLSGLVYALGIAILVLALHFNPPSSMTEPIAEPTSIEVTGHSAIVYVPPSKEIEEEIEYDHYEYNIEVISQYVAHYQSSIIHSTISRTRAIYEIVDEHQDSSYARVSDWARNRCQFLYELWQEYDSELEVLLLVQSVNKSDLIIYHSTNGE